MTGNKRLAVLFCMCFILTSCGEQSSAVHVPKTMHPVVRIEKGTPQRVKDLSKLAYALEKYKQKHHQYPISSNSGTGYDGLFVNEKYGENREEWILGLAPRYIDKLPRDPRNDSDIHHSYLYISNGAHYKLIAQRPTDCQEVKIKYPLLIDPRRDCYSYGYWTKKAANW